MYYLLKKSDLPKFFKILLKKYEVIAPVKRKDLHSFDPVSSFADVDLDFTNTLYPPKNYFLPAEDELFTIKSVLKPEYDNVNRVIFGMRACDVNALNVVDKLFLDENKDPYYAIRRANTIIIALNCNEAGENCFCTSFEKHKVEEGFDLLFTDSGRKYIVEVGSKRGEKLVKEKIFKTTEEKPEIILKCHRSIAERQLNKLKKSFDRKIWAKEAKRCLSCGACTVTCPTCPCFDVDDVIDLNMKSGRRVRMWDSCQIKDFTRVAGGYVFRSERSSRLKHRIYHKLDYYFEQFGVPMCSGCGRCVTNCPTDIDMVEIVGRL